MIWLKSIGAVFAGLLVVGIGSDATDFALAAIMPAYDIQHGLTPAMYGVAIVHRTLWGILGGFVVAKLAPRAAMTHAIVLGAIGTMLNVLGMIAMWSVGDHWYPITLAVTSIPATWLGGVLAGARGQKAAA
jgi:uncharacterized membrane protein